MQVPSAADLVRVWELGKDRPAWFRALLMLAPALPEQTFNDLARMTIGRRNINLFRLRERLFGADLVAVAHCPRCAKPSELSPTVRDICPLAAAAEDTPAIGAFDVAIGDAIIACRSPTSEDLAALGVTAEADLRSPVLVERCIVHNSALPPALTPEIIEAVSDAWYDQDPQLQLILGLDCAECGHEWSLPFDCVAFIWTELSNAAQRLLEDVHVLASRYGWREADILAMSAVRRGFYLTRATR